jgi:hypothetical protein
MRLDQANPRITAADYELALPPFAQVRDGPDLGMAAAGITDPGRRAARVTSA